VVEVTHFYGTKTKRIADRSATNCDTHTPSHTDRQSTLDKYMIYTVFPVRGLVYPYDWRGFVGAKNMLQTVFPLWFLQPSIAINLSRTVPRYPRFK
jgi:hypothetical protein